MNLSAVASDSQVFAAVEHIQGIAFGKMPAWVKCALFRIVTGAFALLQDTCAIFRRTGCLLPHGSFA